VLLRFWLLCVPGLKALPNFRAVNLDRAGRIDP
jgi:hypothetical protein